MKNTIVTGKISDYLEFLQFCVVSGLLCLRNLKDLSFFLYHVCATATSLAESETFYSAFIFVVIFNLTP